MPPPLSCDHCDRTFTKRYSLNRHLNSIHHVAPLKMPRKAILCPMRNCSDTFAYHGPLRSHLKASHNIQLQGQKLTFSSMKDFFEWKKKEENKFFVKYVKACGVQRLLDNTEVYRFNCHRTGTYIPEGKGLRKLKSQGSCKIGASCPSTITAHRLPNDTVTCTYCLTHVGHETTQEDESNFPEAEAPNPTAVSKQQVIKIIYPSVITNIIAANVPNSTSIVSIVPKLTSTLVQNHDVFNQFKLSDEDQVILSIILGQERSAVELLESIRNITKKEFVENFNALSKKLKSAEDSASLKKMEVPSEMETFLGKLLANDNENPVLFYEHIAQQVEETNSTFGRINFIIMNSLQSLILQSFGNGGIICIDTVFGTSAGGQDYVLVAIFLYSQFSGWSLCGLCMCAKLSEDSLSVIFSQIRSRTGQIVPSILLGDHEDCIRKSWEHAMGKCDMYLVCSWHLDKISKTLLLQGKMDTVRLACTYKLVLNLLECKSKQKFNELADLINASFSGDQPAAFKKFFNMYCIEKKCRCAKLFQMDSLNTATCLMEPIHYLLEHICQSYGEKISHALCTLLQYFRKHTLDGIDIRELEQSTCVDLSADERRASLQLSINNLTSVAERQWSVEDGCRKYTMEREVDGCSLHCDNVSMSCDSCLQSFKCSCINNAICWKICRHIHLLSKLLHGEGWHDVLNCNVEKDMKELCAPTPVPKILGDEVEMEKVLEELQECSSKILANAEVLCDKKDLAKLRNSLLNTLKLSKSLIGRHETTKEQGIQCDVGTQMMFFDIGPKSRSDHDYTLLLD